MTDKYNWIASYNNIVKDYHNESDRAAALLAASFLENQIKEKLQDYFPCNNKIKEIFNAYHPLSTFAGKIEISYALGFLTDRMKADMLLIKKVRNYFTHHPEYVDFEAEPIRGYCTSLELPNLITDNSDSTDSMKSRYLYAIVLVLMYFDRFISNEEKREIPEITLER